MAILEGVLTKTMSESSVFLQTSIQADLCDASGLS